MTQQVHYGTKRIKAQPMTRAEYNAYRGWTLPADENGEDAGFLVEYDDGAQNRANVPGHEGYVSWSPKDVFEAAYQPDGAMSFGHALVALKQGHLVARAGWNGKGMWLGLVIETTGFTLRGEHYATLAGGGLDEAPWIGMKTADNKFVPWLCSQTDMLAQDWGIVA